MMLFELALGVGGSIALISSILLVLRSSKSIEPAPKRPWPNSQNMDKAIKKVKDKETKKELQYLETKLRKRNKECKAHIANKNFLSSYENDAAITAIEIIPGKCTTLFLSKYSDEILTDLKKKVGALPDKHTTSEEKDLHPYGCPNKTGMKYYVHIHTQLPYKDLAVRASSYLPGDLKTFLLGCGTLDGN